MLESIINAMRKPAKFILRDYYELEYLQQSVKGTLGFASNSVQKTKEILLKEFDSFGKHFKLCFADEYGTYKSKAIFINPLDGGNNFSHSLPFFGMVVLVQDSEHNIVSCVINCPALMEIYYAEKGNGAWVERINNYESKKFRLRVSQRKDLLQSLSITDYMSPIFFPMQKIMKTLRVIGSGAVCGSYVASGKADLFISSTTDPIILSAIKLLIIEDGLSL